jgi:hypothetical protein
MFRVAFVAMIYALAAAAAYVATEVLRDDLSRTRATMRRRRIMRRLSESF